MSDALKWPSFHDRNAFSRQVQTGHHCCDFPHCCIKLTFMLSGTRILRAFLIIGCGLSSSSLKECLLGSKFCWPEELDRLSRGSMSNIPTTSGPLPVGVSSGGQEDEEEEQGDSQESFILVWLPERKRRKISLIYMLLSEQRVP